MRPRAGAFYFMAADMVAAHFTGEIAVPLRTCKLQGDVARQKYAESRVSWRWRDAARAQAKCVVRAAKGKAAQAHGRKNGFYRWWFHGFTTRRYRCYGEMSLLQNGKSNSLHHLFYVGKLEQSASAEFNGKKKYGADSVLFE